MIPIETVHPLDMYVWLRDVDFRLVRFWDDKVIEIDGKMYVQDPSVLPATEEGQRMYRESIR